MEVGVFVVVVVEGGVVVEWVDRGGGGCMIGGVRGVDELGGKVEF